MAQKNKQQAATLVAILLVPLVLYFVFREISHPVFNSVPFQYRVEASGDSNIYTLQDFPAQHLNGTPLTSSEYSDRILLIDFFSLADTLRTTVLHGNLQRVYDNIRDTDYIRMFSICTGDTINSDLIDYAADFESYGDTWQVLWMDTASVRQTALGQLGIQEVGKWYDLRARNKEFPEFTSQTLALLDKKGRVRKYFVATDLGEIKRINEDLRALTVLEYPEELNSNQ